MFKVNASRVRQLMFANKLTISTMAKAAQINAITARRAIADGATATGKTVGALANLFGVDGNELILRKDDDHVL